MDEPGKGLFSVAEAAAIWNITRQAVYKRLDNLDKRGLTSLHGGKRYITRAGIEAYNLIDNRNDNQNDNESTTSIREVDRLSYQVDRLTNEVDSLKTELTQTKTQLQEALGRALILQATTEAQQAHIDSLKTALDREQSLHMASLQQRLPAHHESGGIFSWLRKKKTEEE